MFEDGGQRHVIGTEGKLTRLIEKNNNKST